MIWQMTIWVIIVVAVSAGLLVGVLALTNRIQAIDERLSELRLLELELTRMFKWAVTNLTSELNAIKPASRSAQRPKRFISRSSPTRRPGKDGRYRGNHRSGLA